VSDPSKALVNGYGAAHVTKDGNGIIVYYVFPPAATVKKEITKVELTVTWPKLGEKAVLTAKLPADANYTLEGGKIGWYIDEDNAFIAEGAVYEAKTYIFSATLVPKEGYVFAADPELSATLNGESVSIWTGEGGKAFLKKYVTLGLENPFTDVKESDYFFKAVLWAVEQGVTNGTGNGEFSPKQTCSSAHIITFLYRALGIGENGWGEESRNWAIGEGLTAETGLTISKDEDCPRSAVVTFLYRAYADK